MIDAIRATIAAMIVEDRTMIDIRHEIANDTTGETIFTSVETVTEDTMIVGETTRARPIQDGIDSSRLERTRETHETRRTHQAAPHEPKHPRLSRPTNHGAHCNHAMRNSRPSSLPDSCRESTLTNTTIFPFQHQVKTYP